MASYVFYTIFIFLAFLFFKSHRISKNLLDFPNSRSTHTNPVPRGAGIIFSTLSTIYASSLGSFNFLFCYPLSIVGFLDDKLSLPSSIRFLTQYLTSFSLLLYIKYSYFINLTDLNILVILFLSFLGTAIINFVNFLDCLNGLITSTLLIVFLTLSLEYHTLIPLILSLICFLLFNWNPAKLFMGDAGSTFLGAVFFSLVIDTNQIDILISRVLLISPLLLDAISCICLRYLYGFNIFKAHKMHLAQRLYLAGWSHEKVTLLYIFLTLLMSFSYLYANLYLSIILCFIMFVFGIFLDRRFASPFPRI